MPVRRLTRGGSSESGGSAEKAPGSAGEPLGAAHGPDRQAGSEADEMVTGAAGAVAGGEKEPSRHESDGGPAEAGQFIAVPADVLKDALMALLKDGKEESGESSKQSSKESSQGGKQEPAVSAAMLKQALLAVMQEVAEQWPGGGSKGKQQEDPYSEIKLQHAAAEVISQLHAAKQELAKELEANLKQLKSVLQETQRIAKDMEAVLKEAKAEPDAQDLARGGGGKHPTGEWKPPGYKGDQQAKGKQDDESEDQEDSQGKGQQQKKQGWEPPQEALQH